MAQLTPYLSFNSNCREAMNFYKDCLGGELTLQTVGSMPEMAAQMPPELKDHIMHATLKSNGFTIHASDLNRAKHQDGNTYHLCLHCDSEEQLRDFFTKLSQGGTITNPVGDMPWGALYAECDDKFGKHWMFNFQKS